MRDASKHPRPFVFGVCCACVVVLAIAPLAATANGPINPGDDIWGTPCGGGTYVDFSANPIPAGFFGPGSDQFSGQVSLGGDPSGIFIQPQPVPPMSGFDTVVQRGGTSLGFTCGSTETVPIEIIALNLVSCAPITVTFNGGTSSSQWDVRVCLDGLPQPIGTMTISHECPSGGSYTSSLPVNAQISFTDPLGGFASMPHPLTMGSSGWWSHTDPGVGIDRIPAGSFIMDNCTGLGRPSVNTPIPDFFPGLWSGDCIDCITGPGNFQKPMLTPEQALLAAHGIYPPNPEKSPGPTGFPVVTEACCLPDGTCVDVSPTDCVALWGGTPQGLGTNCANTPCGGALGCPLDPTDPAALCLQLQTFMCDTGTASDTCLASAVHIDAATGGLAALACECFAPSTKCGPITVEADFNTLTCNGDCPFPNPIGTCTVFADGVSQNSSSVLASDYAIGTVFDCQCAGPPPDDHITVGPTTVEFGGGASIPLIPADFFGPGSQPFAGTVPMEGVPGGPSVRLQRSADPVAPSDLPGTQGTVDTEMVSLDLRSVDPITVVVGTTTELWDLRVSNLGSSGEDGVRANPGSFVATKDHTNGGTFVAGFLVCPVLTFTRVSDGVVQQLDLCPSVPFDITEALDFNISGPFTHNVDPNLGIAVPPGATMTTGIEHEDIGIAQQVVQLQAITKDVPPSVIHTVEPIPICLPNAAGTACQPIACSAIPEEQCLPKCVNYDPLTGSTRITDCDCLDTNGSCWVNFQGVGGPAPANVGPGGPCVVVDDGTGTVTLPPIGCDYLSPDEVHTIVDGLPAGTTIELAAIHKDFICAKGGGNCSLPIPPGDCERGGGSLGGSLDCFQSTLELTVTGNGPPLGGFNRTLFVPVDCEVHTGPRNPGDALQDFPTDMFRLQGQLFGDPDFCTFVITGGTDNGLPSAGHTSLTRQGPPGSDFVVDSFFDITYRIDFQGCPGSVLEGFAGSTTSTIRMSTTGPPGCAGDCPVGTICERSQVSLPDGTIDICCDCVPEPTGACCLSTGPCQVMTQTNCEAASGVYAGDGTVCGGVEACCLPATGTCIDTDTTCCVLQGGTPQGAGSACNDGTVDCSVPCLPDATGTACQPVICPDANDVCEPRCVQFDPLTGITTVIDCDCRGVDECHVGGTGGPTPEGGGNPCVVGNVGGTVVLPPVGCDYLSPDEVHMIVDGLPAGATLELAPIHNEFICSFTGGPQVPCSQNLGASCEGAGGGLGGNLDCFNSLLQLQVTGSGPAPIGGFARTLNVQVSTEVHTGLRTPGQAVQDFDTEMFRLSGEIFGDPDFCTFRVTGGSDFGLPSPGHTTLRRLGPAGSNFSVDSFFDITYQIEYVGCPGSALEGLSGTTTATIRMETGTKPNCVGGCPQGQVCNETLTVDPGTGIMDICCDCVDEVVGVCCFADAAIPCQVTTQTNCIAQGGQYGGDNTSCSAVQACCLPGTGACVDLDRTCCILRGGTPQGVGSACNDGVVDCSLPCLPDATGTGCEPVICPDTTESCEARCVQYDPLTGITTVTDCDCRGIDECQVDMAGTGGPMPLGGGNPCVVPPGPPGTITLPPAGCDYLSPDEVHAIIDGLTPPVTIELAAIHKDFICRKSEPSCSAVLAPFECETTGGSLGGNLDCFRSDLVLAIQGTAPPLAGFTRNITMFNVFTEVHTGPRTPGQAVQDFDTNMFRLEGELFGDPDFCTLKITAGTDNGLPSPGHTTLTKLAGGNYSVDSFFDIAYRIEFQGCPGSILEGLSGTTTGTIRMETGAAPNCVGGCAVGEVCEETRTVDPLTGMVDLCCDCVPEITGACCTAANGCVVTTQLDCLQQGGVYSGDGSACGPIVACCLPDGSCTDIERNCCGVLLGGVPQAAGSACNDGVVDCSLPCEPNTDGSACEPVVCPDVMPPLGVACEPRCVTFDPITGASRITDCECRGPDECHVAIVGPAGGPVPEGPGGNPCVVTDAGGTVVLPPIGCDYLSPDEVHMILNDLPAGTTIELAAIHKDFICNKQTGVPGACSTVIPPGLCEVAGGGLGGNVDCFESTLELVVTGQGSLGGFNRTLFVPVSSEVHTGSRTPGDPVQEFDTDMFRLQGQLFGDPDFCTFRVTGGSDNGLPSPGHTTLTQLPGGNWQVDSFFDITYRIDFQGCPGSALDGMSGTTQATIRMQTGGAPQCVGGCAANETCERSTVVNADGTMDMCCDCVPAATCTTAADCADVAPADGITDDVCTWWACVAGACVATPLNHPSDMGGAFGACPPDTFCNLADALHALTCFASNNPCDPINIDAGGAFGSCVPDGFCNLADALHALTCFAGDNLCTCGPAPEVQTNVVGAVSLSAVADRRAVKAGGEVQVRVFLDEALPNLKAYQLHTVVSGGRSGRLELVNVSVEDRKDAVFAGSANAFDAFNVEKGQMLRGLFSGDVATGASGYLATFTFRASSDAVGAFVVDVVHDEANQDQTFLVGAQQTDKIEVRGVQPAVIVVNAGSARSVR